MNSQMTLSEDILEVLFLGRADVPIVSSSVSTSGSHLFLGLQGGTVESSVLVRKDENVWTSDTTQNVLHLKVRCLEFKAALLPRKLSEILPIYCGDTLLCLQQDEIKEIYPIPSLDIVLIHTRGNSLLLLDLHRGFVKIALRHRVFAVSLNDGGGQPMVAVLRATSMSKALTASVYAVESRYLKHVWECKIEIEGTSMDQPSVAFIDAPFSLLVFHHRHFVWVGIDPETQHPKRRDVFMKQGDGLCRVVQTPGRDGQALIVSDDIGILVDRCGDPVGNSISFGGLESPIHDIAVCNSFIIVVTRSFLHLINIESGARSKVNLADPEGLYWRLGTFSRFSSNLLVSLHCGERVWLICSLSPMGRLQRALNGGNALQAKALIDCHPELMSNYNIMKTCADLFFRASFVRDAIRILERFAMDDHDPSVMFHLFPEYTKGFCDVQPMEVQSLQSIWDENHVEDGRAKNDDRQAVLEYLFRIREFPGMTNIEGVDTLIVHVMIDLDLKEAVAAFLSAPNHAVPRELAGRLKAKDWRHALALVLRKDFEHVDEAICLWKDLANDAEECEEAQGLVQSTLSNASLCLPELVLKHLPWVLEIETSYALDILHHRPDIPVDGVLKIVSDVPLKCQYLQVAISYGENKTSSYVHTELALALIQLMSQEYNIEGDLGFGGVLREFYSLLKTDGRKNPAIFVAGSFQNLPKFQTVLHAHLVQHTTYIDLEFLGSELTESMIHEKAIIAAVQGDHDDVVEILVSGSCANVPAAIDYIKTFVPRMKHHDMLMKYILECDVVRPWDIAGQLIASFDHCTIDATKMVDGMPHGMELCHVKQALSRMIQSIIHRRREKEMTRSMLQRALFSLKTITRDCEQASPCTISEGTTCSQCSLKISNTACVQVQNESILCLHCFNNKM